MPVPPARAISRPLALSLLLVAAACTGQRYVATPGTTASQDTYDPQRRLGPHEVVTDAPIRTRDDRFFDIRRVVVRGGEQYLAGDAANGFDRYDQNRLPLADFPLVGHAFVPRFHEADFAEAHRVGQVFAGGDTLHAVLDVLIPTPEHVVIVHRDYAYVVPNLHAARAPPPTQGGRPVAVGTAYSPRPGLLLLLVRPSVLTDTPL